MTPITCYLIVCSYYLSDENIKKRINEFEGWLTRRGLKTECHLIDLRKLNVDQVSDFTSFDFDGYRVGLKKVIDNNDKDALYCILNDTFFFRNPFFQIRYKAFENLDLIIRSEQPVVSGVVHQYNQMLSSNLGCHITTYFMLGNIAFAKLFMEILDKVKLGEFEEILFSKDYIRKNPISWLINWCLSDIKTPLMYEKYFSAPAQKKRAKSRSIFIEYWLTKCLIESNSIILPIPRSIIFLVEMNARRLLNRMFYAKAYFRKVV